MWIVSRGTPQTRVAAGRGRWAAPQGCARVKSSFVLLILDQSHAAGAVESGGGPSNG
jgi:hypothetical protein